MVASAAGHSPMAGGDEQSRVVTAAGPVGSLVNIRQKGGNMLGPG